jgi:galactose mutarotase-like enzyme
MHTIDNGHIKISVASKGAELKSFIDKTSGQEYMWSGDPVFWGKTSPVLFPIVGSLKDNTYFDNEKPYHLGRHGFARDMEFELASKTENSLSFLLKSTEETLKVFPFEFEFYIIYKIERKKCSVNYVVKNTGITPMYFSVGGHPAFAVPIFAGDVYTDYVLAFNKVENAGRYPIVEGGLLKTVPAPFLLNTAIVPLHKDLFKFDAIVLKHLNSTNVKLVSVKNGKGILFDFTGFPYLGIWAAPNADFVCLEPWCGIADSEYTTQQLTTKEGIQALRPAEKFDKTWSVEVI